MKKIECVWEYHEEQIKADVLKKENFYHEPHEHSRTKRD